MTETPASAAAAIIERASHLTRAQVLGLAAAGYRAWNGHDIEDAEDAPESGRTERDAAFDAARDAAVGAGLDTSWDALQDGALQAVWKAVLDEPERGFSEARAELAAEAAADAACATLVRHLITPAQRSLLTGPWEQIVHA